jgi:hypothetical protein
MSHFAKVRVNITDAATLKSALIACGIEPAHIDVHETPVCLRSYTGSKIKTQAHVVVRREHIASNAADMGWELGENGFAHVDEYHNKYTSALGVVRFVGGISQEYSAQVFEKKARAKGKTPVRQKDEKTGVIKVLANA